jgi:glucose-1-phosphate thymidylyltransferase
MTAIILAAGYATRLYPLTLTRPKPLLPIAGRPLLEYIIDRLGEVGGIDSVYLVTNTKFAPQFRAWASGAAAISAPFRICVVDDGTSDEANKRGAIGDIMFTMRAEGIVDDCVVVAGDNLMSGNLEGFGALCRENGNPLLGVYDVRTAEAAQRFGVVSVDAGGTITRFEEKPAHPRSTLVSAALYFYPRSIFPLLEAYVREGRPLDPSGRFIEWLCTRVPVYAYTIPGIWYDIGTREALEEADKAFRQLRSSVV